MIAIDTNVVVRFLTQDDPTQCKIVNQFFNKIQSSNQAIYISQITICEVVWVLQECYEQTKAQMIQILQAILTTPYFIIENMNAVWEAFCDYREVKNAGFADCLIGRNNLNQGCLTTYTFDVKAAKQLKSFKLLT